MRRYTTYHNAVGVGYDRPPHTYVRVAEYSAEVDPALLKGDWKEDAEVIFGHAWPGRADRRWHAKAEGYHFHSMEHTDTGVVFKVDVNRRPGYYMWIDGYLMRGPW